MEKKVKTPLLHKILRYSIPGYLPYSRKEEQREKDRLIRYEYLKNFYECQSYVGRVLRIKIKERKWEEVWTLKHFYDRLEELIAKARASPDGYAGLFTWHKVDETKLSALQRIDFEIKQLSERMLDAAVKLGETDPKKFEELVVTLYKYRDEVEVKFEQRMEVARGVE